MFGDKHIDHDHLHFFGASVYVKGKNKGHTSLVVFSFTMYNTNYVHF